MEGLAAGFISFSFNPSQRTLANGEKKRALFDLNNDCCQVRVRWTTDWYRIVFLVVSREIVLLLAAIFLSIPLRTTLSASGSRYAIDRGAPINGAVC